MGSARITSTIEARSGRAPREDLLTRVVRRKRLTLGAGYVRNAGVLAGWTGGVPPPKYAWSCLFPAALPQRQEKMRHDNFIPTPRLGKIRSRGRLPHWEVDDAIYFITFRLRDSLPREVQRALMEEHERMMRIAAKKDRARLEHQFTLHLDRELDKSHGSCILNQHAELVANALRHFDGERYQLHSWCVMPNHVHVLVHLDEGRNLENVLHSWKSYTAHQIDQGLIWQREYHDRVIRSPREYADTAEYIRRNPMKAGLKDWRWVG